MTFSQSEAKFPFLGCPLSGEGRCSMIDLIVLIQEPLSTFFIPQKKFPDENGTAEYETEKTAYINSFACLVGILQILFGLFVIIFTLIYFHLLGEKN